MPTDISRNSDPFVVTKGTLASPAIALAGSVVPGPRGPTNIPPWNREVKPGSSSGQMEPKETHIFYLNRGLPGVTTKNPIR